MPYDYMNTQRSYKKNLQSLLYYCIDLQPCSYISSITVSFLEHTQLAELYYRVGHEKVATFCLHLHLATVLISVFLLCYGPGLLFRGPPAA